MISSDSSSREIVFSCMNSALLLDWRCDVLTNGTPIVVKPGPAPLSMLAGVHGDERSGPVFLTKLLRRYVDEPLTVPTRGLVIVPLFNDSGWDVHEREWNDIDLNREFNLETPVEHVQDMMLAMQVYGPVVHWDIHEDDERSEHYVYGYASSYPNVAEALSEHMKCSLEASDGAIDSDGNSMDGSSDEFAHNLGIASLTTETNPIAPMKDRLAWLQRAYDFIVNNPSW